MFIILLYCPPPVDKEEGDEYVESLSRPVSGEKTSSTHDDTESVGSAVRPTSGTSGSISGNYVSSTLR